MLIVFGLLSLYLLSTDLVANLLIRPLENNYPPLQEKVKADVIVILTAGLSDLSYHGLEHRPDSSSLERLVEGYQIYKQLSGVPVIISGGRADPTKPNISIGESLGRTAIALGIPKNNLLVEDDSVNTYEGALRVSAILKGKGQRVVLVTSASHMARSVRLYKKVGFDVIPAPTNFIGEPISLNLYSFIPTAGSLTNSSTALYEYLSTLWYILRDVI